MHVRLLPSAPGRPDDRQYLHTFLIDDVLAIDAGSLGLYGEPATQARVRDVFVTHSHADHVASLPVFLENVAGDAAGPPVVHGLPATVEALRRHVFNDVIWPDFEGLGDGAGPWLRFSELSPLSAVRAGALAVTPVPVHHVVPAVGYLVDDGSTAVLISGDTGPTDRLWELAAATPHLAAVFLELSFPDALASLARRAAHLTPALFAEQAGRLAPDVRVLAYHVKARHRGTVVAELAALGSRFEVARSDVTYSF